LAGLPRFAVLVFLGTFAPAALASDRPIAIACLRLVTFRPERPFLNVPALRSFIARSTLADAFFEYFLAMMVLLPARNQSTQAAKVPRDAPTLDSRRKNDRKVFSSPHGDSDTTHGGRQFQADPDAVQLEDHTSCILQHNTACTARDRRASADRTIGAGEISWRVQMQRAPDHLGSRCADCCSEAHAGNHEPIMVTSESQDTVPPANADDKSALCEDDANCSSFRPRRR
jgi:hypothetical protein